MIVITTARTPSLKASMRPLLILVPSGKSHLGSKLEQKRRRCTVLSAISRSINPKLSKTNLNQLPGQLFRSSIPAFNQRRSGPQVFRLPDHPFSSSTDAPPLPRYPMSSHLIPVWRAFHHAHVAAPVFRAVLRRVQLRPAAPFSPARPSI